MNRPSGRGTSSSRKEGSSSMKSSRAGAGSASLATADSRAGAGSASLPTIDSLPSVTGRLLTSLGPWVHRPVLGIRLLWKLRSLWTPVQLEPVHRRLASQWEQIVEVKIRRCVLTQMRQPAMAQQWAGLMTRLQQAVVQQAWLKQAWCGLSPWQHTVSNMESRSTRPTGPCQPPVQQQPVTQNCRTREDPDRATKSRFNPASQHLTEIWRCPLFLCPWWQACRIQPARWCSRLAWVCNMDHQTWQLRWREPATCNNKRRMMSFGFNHHNFFLWTSRCCFPDHSLCNSLQLPLVHWAVMLSPWLQPCGGGWTPCYNNSSIWLFQAMDMERLGLVFTRLQAHPDLWVWWVHLGFQHLLKFITHRQGCRW